MQVLRDVWLGRGGFVAMRRDRYPHLDQVAPGILAAMGYNGRGVAMATVLGKVMADRTTGYESCSINQLDRPNARKQPVEIRLRSALVLSKGIA